MTQIFVESCVDFEVAHLSVFMVWRLPYPKVPTLSLHCNVQSPHTIYRYTKLNEPYMLVLILLVSFRVIARMGYT